MRRDDVRALAVEAEAARFDAGSMEGRMELLRLMRLSSCLRGVSGGRRDESMSVLDTLGILVLGAMDVDKGVSMERVALEWISVTLCAQPAQK